MLAGVTKKVGVYAIVRLYFTVLAGASIPVDVLGVTGDSPLSFLAPALAAMGVASIVVGGLGAVSRDTLEGTFAYSSVGQVGFIVVPVAIAAASTGQLRQIALVAALVYALHHSLAKSLLFLSAAAVTDATGTNRVRDVGGLAGHSPVLAGAFFVGILSLVGLPPLAGFFGKFFVFDVSIRWYATAAGWAPIVVFLSLLAGALLTIVYTTRTWTGCFWGAETTAVEGSVVDGRQLAVLVALAAVVVGVGVGFDPVYRFAESAATAATERGEYVETVFPDGGGAA
jgi:multicomponent Na+:H+ antiporter subunit D